MSRTGVGSPGGGRGDGGCGLRVEGPSGGGEGGGDYRPALARPRSTARGKFTPTVDQTLKDHQASIHGHCLPIHLTAVIIHNTETAAFLF